MRSLKASFVYFLLVFGAGFVLGMIRVPLLEPRLGARMAELIEMPVMFVVIVLAARRVVRRFGLEPAIALRLAIGLLALALLVLCELALVVALRGQSVADYVASRDPVSGSAYVVMLVLFALMPALVRRR